MVLAAGRPARSSASCQVQTPKLPIKPQLFVHLETGFSPGPEPGAGVQTPKLPRIPNLSARILYLHPTGRARCARTRQVAVQVP